MRNLGTVISLPFRFGTEQGVENLYGGSTLATNDYRTIWKDRVFVACLTGLGERVMTPNYGTEVLDSLFEDETRAEALCKETIASAFSTWLPDLTLSEVLAAYDSYSGSLEITVNYILPSGEEDTTSLKTNTFDPYGNIIREGS